MNNLPKILAAGSTRPTSAAVASFTAANALPILELAAAALLAFQLARLVWVILVPAAPLGAWVPPARPTATVDIAALSGFDGFFRQSADEDASVVSSLALTLLGTRVDTVSGRGSAIIATPDGIQKSFLVGETIIPGVRLRSVEFDGVTIDRGGASERLLLDQSSGSDPVTPAALPPVPAAAATALMNEIAATPRLAGTTITGFTLAPKGNGAAFAAAGLQAGDVLVAVNGRPVAELGDPAALPGLLGAGPVAVDIERSGRPLKLSLGQPQ